MSGYAFLARIHEPVGERPLVQRDLAAFHDGAGRDRELARAAIAVKETFAGRLAFQAIDLLRLAAMRAERALRPVDALEVFAGLVGIGENRVGKVHGVFPSDAKTTPSGYLRQVYNRRSGWRCSRLQTLADKSAYLRHITFAKASEADNRNHSEAKRNNREEKPEVFSVRVEVSANWLRGRKAANLKCLRI
jgi:hypothetical protein